MFPIDIQNAFLTQCHLTNAVQGISCLSAVDNIFVIVNTHIFLFFLFVEFFLEDTPVRLGSTSWICTQESFLVSLRDHRGFWELNPDQLCVEKVTNLLY